MQSQLLFQHVRGHEVTMARNPSLLQVQKHLFKILQDLLKLHRPLDFPGVLLHRLINATALVEKALQISLGALLPNHVNDFVATSLQILVGARLFELNVDSNVQILQVVGQLHQLNLQPD